MLAASEAADEKDRQNRDLIAQEAMAHWAYLMVWVAGLQALLAVAGLWALLRSLKLNREAVRQAQRSADGAIKAADAAERSVAVATDTAQRQLRAYVSVGKTGRVDLKDRSGVPAFQLEMVNSGQTPAYEVKNVVCITFAEYPLESELDPAMPHTHKVVLAPGAEKLMHGAWSRKITPEEDKALFAREAAVYVYGRIEYKDTFGQDRFTNFRYFYNAIVGPNIGLLACPDGNDSN